MAKESIDWDALANALNPPRTAACEQYDPLNGSMRKIAFDTYEKVSDGSLWELREVDGKKMLFALYDDEQAKVATAGSSSRWNAHPDSSEKNVTLFYDDVPVYKFAASDFDFHGDAHRFASFVVCKMSDKEFRDGVLSQLTPVRKEAVLKVIGGGE